MCVLPDILLGLPATTAGCEIQFGFRSHYFTISMSLAELSTTSYLALPGAYLRTQLAIHLRLQASAHHSSLRKASKNDSAPLPKDANS